MDIANQRGDFSDTNRIGVLLHGFENANLDALYFLLLQMNCQQTTFEYEFLPVDKRDNLTRLLSSGSEVPREEVRASAGAFLDRHNLYVSNRISKFGIKESPPSHYVLITKAGFSDRYYSMHSGNLSVLALGNWERHMSPPSVFEYILTLLVREAIASISPSLRGSIHLGTKGCLFDFTQNLRDVRQKVLLGFICSYCRSALSNDQLPELADEQAVVLGRQWLGRSSRPTSPAGIISKLGYDLFATRGFEATRWERFQLAVKEQTTTQLFTIIGGVLLAALLVWLGLQS